MKTFDKKDLITWANRDKAVIGNWYYFGDTIDHLKFKIQEADTYKLVAILNNSFISTFKNYCNHYYPCILPADAVKDKNIEPKKKYRPCRTIQEFYELVFNTKSKDEERFYIDGLLGTPIYLRGKYQNEFYTILTQINIIDGKYLIVLNGAMFSFNELFNNFEIEINGEWKPFGILDDN